LRGFLQTLVENEAVCDLELKDDVFRFRDLSQVRRSVARLQQDNIHEENRSLVGQFLGVLPHRRSFEFQITEPREIIVGKVGPNIEDAGSINHVLSRDITIQVHTKRAGTGRPTYTLLGYERPEQVAESS